MISKSGWIGAGALALLVVAWLSGVVVGGSLDPSALPAPTMKTLEEIPGSWSLPLAANNGTPASGCNSTRFQCVLGSQAALDRETGLVWSRDAFNVASSSWGVSKTSCWTTQVAGRRGWRLPTLEELQTLYDLSVGAAPKVPVGHPFINVQSGDAYWTDTSAGGGSIQSFRFDGVTAAEPKTNTNLTWCVRGGRGYNIAP